VTRVPISSPLALWRGVLFPIPFLAMLVYAGWKALTGEISSIAAVPPGSPGWSKWLVLVVWTAVTIYLCWSVMLLKRVTLVDDRLLISNLTTNVDIPLSEVQSIQWTREAADFNTPEASLVLRQPTALGTDILFEPRSAAAFELLRAKIEAANTATP
jgi:hypothetical protein